LPFMFIAMLISASAAPHPYTWVGGNSGDVWSDNTNWLYYGSTAANYPGQYTTTDFVVIESTGGAHDPTLDVTVSVIEVEIFDNTTLHNNGVNSLTVTGAIGVIFLNGSNATLDFSHGTSGTDLIIEKQLYGTGNLYLYGAGQTVEIDGDLTFSGVFKSNDGTHFGSTVYLNGSAAQSLDASSGSITFDNLNIDNTNGVTNNESTMLEVSGNLSGAGSLDPTTYDLIINGDITIATLIAGTGSSTLTMSSGETQTLNGNTFNNLTIANANTIINLGGNIVINGALNINAGATVSAGNYVITGTGNVTFASGSGLSTALVHGMDDAVTATGTLSFNTGMNLTLNGSSAQVTGSANQPLALNSLTINNTSGVTLSNNLEVNDTFMIQAGSFANGGHTLSYGGSGTLSYSGSSPQTSTNNEFPASNGPATLNINNISGVTLHAPRTVTTLAFSSGIFTLGANKFTINPIVGSITGYDKFKYVVTGSGGILEMNASTGGVVYPVGDDYNVIAILDANANTYDVSVTNGVTESDGVTPVTDWAVNRTWTVSQSSGGTTTVTVIPQWNNTTDLASGHHFDLTDAFLAYRDINITNAWTDQSGTNITGQISAPVYNLTSSSLNMTSGNIYNFSVGGGVSSPLPVTLLNFSVKYVNNNDVNLSWSTASEMNNDYFGIERSADGDAWQNIGQVQGNGNSQVIVNYSATDNLQGVVPSGTIYYRLKQVDFNGKYQYSDIRTVNLAEGNISMEIYPIPVSDVLNIDFEGGNSGNAMLNVINILGKTLYTEHIENKGLINKQINFSGYPAGTYFLQIMSNGIISTKKIIHN